MRTVIGFILNMIIAHMEKSCKITAVFSAVHKLDLLMLSTNQLYVQQKSQSLGRTDHTTKQAR